MQTPNNTISINYSLKWQIKDMPNYQFTQCGKLFNTKTGRVKKQCLNGSSIGYWIERKFFTLEYFRNKLEKIKEIECPF